MPLEYLSKVDVVFDDTIEIVTDADVGKDRLHICVFYEKSSPSVYYVCVDGVIRHPKLDAHGAMRALGQYLMNFGNINNLA